MKSRSKAHDCFQEEATRYSLLQVCFSCSKPRRPRDRRSVNQSLGRKSRARLSRREWRLYSMPTTYRPSRPPWNVLTSPFLCSHLIMAQSGRNAHSPPFDTVRYWPAHWPGWLGDLFESAQICSKAHEAVKRAQKDAQVRNAVVLAEPRRLVAPCAMQPLPGKCAMTAALILGPPLVGNMCEGIHPPAEDERQEDHALGQRHLELSFGSMLWSSAGHGQELSWLWACGATRELTKVPAGNV